MTLSQAVILGRAHRLKEQNGQDVAFTRVSTPGTAVGLVLDGCGSPYRDAAGVHPSENEIGARLLGSFAADFLCRQVSDGADAATAVTDLYPACLRFLRGLAALFPAPEAADRQRFIYTRLLCTLLGFVITPETAVCFWRGDGFVVVNGRLLTLAEDNRPDYLAYDLLRAPTGFRMLSLWPRASLAWLALASDGWQPAHLCQLQQPHTSLRLQRRLRLLARERGSFEDDGAIAIFYNDAGVES